MATVFQAEDLKHRRKVAIKVLNPELGATLNAERFLHEIRVTAALHHPHILALHVTERSNAATAERLKSGQAGDVPSVV